MQQGRKTRIGIIGSGYIARGLIMLVAKQPDLAVSHILTRRDLATCADFPAPDLLTNSVNAIIDHSDLVVECSGDVIHGTAVLAAVMGANLPVVTMDAELQATTGSYFVDKGLITEAEGDQPGCLAALHEEAVEMGFQPLVYGNIKGFLNNDPSFDEMCYWSAKQGISLSQATAATDGTKVQFEQALIANGLGADIAQTGLSYIQEDSLRNGANKLAMIAETMGTPISDCLLLPQPPAANLTAGIFVTGTHDDNQSLFLQYYKMGNGPFYTLHRPYHLPHLEIIKTIRRMINGGGVLLTNSFMPRISVAAVAKRQLQPGEKIARGIGSFAMRGTAVRHNEYPNHLPIGLAHDIVMRRIVDANAILTFDDVELPNSFALQVWREIHERVSAQSIRMK